MVQIVAGGFVQPDFQALQEPRQPQLLQGRTQ